MKADETKQADDPPTTKKKKTKRRKKSSAASDKDDKESVSFAASEPDSTTEADPAPTTLSTTDKSRSFMLRNSFRDKETDTGVPDHWQSSSDEEIGHEDTPFFKQPTEEDGGDRMGEELTRFILEEQQEEQMDPLVVKFHQDMRATMRFKARLRDGISVKRVLTKYLTPGGKKFVRTTTHSTETKKNLVRGKTFMVEVDRVLYLQADEKTINWRGPKTEAEGYASPFMLTRTRVENYMVSHLLKPLCSERKRFIRLVFKCPETASIQYGRMEIDIIARNSTEYDEFKEGFTLLWRYYSYRLKLLEQDPKMLLRKQAARPKTREERWELEGYKPLVLQELDPDNKITNLYIAGGLSLEDALLIVLLMLSFYGFMLYAICLMTKAHLDAASGFVLWCYFYVVCIIGGLLLFSRALSKIDLDLLGLSGTVTLRNSRHVVTTVPQYASGKQVGDVIKDLINVPRWFMYVFFVELFLFGTISLLFLAWRGLYDRYRAFRRRGGFTQMAKDGYRELKWARLRMLARMRGFKDDCQDCLLALADDARTCPKNTWRRTKQMATQACKALMGKPP